MTVQRFVKKPVEIEAVRWTGENTDEVCLFLGFMDRDAQNRIPIQTLEGTMRANVGDWLIRGVNGEHYPCKPDIFDQSYEEVDAPDYITGTGQPLWNVHPRNDGCDNLGCAVHAPSDHAMKDFLTHWRQDRRIMERICPHGVGHPDPDHLAFVRRTFGPEAAFEDSVHGCDGCCG